MTVQEAAGVLGVHENTVLKWIRAKSLTAFQGIARGRWLIPIAALREKWEPPSDD